MVHEDTVTCEGCGAEITHLICGAVTEDEDYRMCDACIEERDAQLDEPDHNDAVLCCPDCERPNQFGEICSSCERDRQAEIEENRL